MDSVSEHSKTKGQYKAPDDASIKAFMDCLQSEIRKNKKALGIGARASRMSFLRGMMDLLRKAKTAKVPNKRLVEIMAASGIDVSLSTLRAFWKSQSKDGTGKSEEVIDLGSVREEDGQTVEPERNGQKSRNKRADTGILPDTVHMSPHVSSGDTSMLKNAGYQGDFNINQEEDYK